MKPGLRSITSEDIDWLHDEFITFGNPQSPIWFLGLEEGDHPEKDQLIDDFIHRLLKKTKLHHDKGVVSLRELCAPKEGYKYLPAIDYSMPKSAKGVTFQNTWGGYIKLLFSINYARTGEDWNLDDVKIYQKYSLGSAELNEDELGSCLLELFPMARKGRTGQQWPYAKLADRANLEYFDKAKNYKNKVEMMRAERLLRLVDKHEPEFVFAFGGDCRSAICKVLHNNLHSFQVDSGKKCLPVHTLKHGSTRFVFSNHPTSRGVSDLYWRNLGEQVVAL